MERSENRFVDYKDTFLHMTIFISIKTLYSLRTTCKRINQWLSDPTTFSWKQRIRNTFPNSYEDVLKLTMEHQIRKLLKFDPFIDKGHRVACYPLIKMPLPPPTRPKVTARLPTVTQLPWKKNISVFCQYNQANFYDTNTNSMLGQILDLGTPYEQRKVLLNINDRTVGFLSGKLLKLYRYTDGNEVIHERDYVINYIDEQTRLSILFRRTLRQMYGDCIVLIEPDKYLLYSIITNSVVHTMQLPGNQLQEKLSKLTPVGYVLYSANRNQYFIQEVNFLTRQSKDPILIDLGEDISVGGIHLIEDASNKYLSLCGSSGTNFSVQLYDLHQNKPIFNRSLCKPKEFEAKSSNVSATKISPNMRYYSIRCNKEFTVHEINGSEDTEAEILSKEEQEKVLMIKWINNDIFAAKISGQTRFDVCAFISAKQRQVIGFIDDIFKIFRDGNKVFAYDLMRGLLYSINFTDTSVRL